MLFDFFFTVRKAGVPASVKEFLTLLEALDRGGIQNTLATFRFVRLRVAHLIVSGQNNRRPEYQELRLTANIEFLNG